MILSTGYYSVDCKKPEPVLIPIGDARIVGKLPSGNFEVTPAFIVWAKDQKDQLAIALLKLEKCQELLEKKKGE